MTHEQVKLKLNDYFDEQLSIEVNTEIQVHLSECSDCSQYLYSLQDLMKKADKLPRSIKPGTDLWNDIFSSLSEIKAESIKQKEEINQLEAIQQAEESAELRKKRKEREKAEKTLKWEQKKVLFLQKLKTPSSKYTLVGIAGVLIIFLIYILFFLSGRTWEVTKLRVGSNTFSEKFGLLEEDEFLETESMSRLQISIPDIGHITVEPNSKVQRIESNQVRLINGSVLIVTNETQEHLSVEIPGAEITNFSNSGQYRVSIIDDDTSYLNATEGWIKIKMDELESLVLPNHRCKIINNFTLGLPYQNNSTGEFIKAIDDYCFNNSGSEESLIEILTKADITNSVTLWNLMSRVTRKQRDMVIYTIFGLLGNPPSGVTDEGLRTLNPEMMQKLIEEIEKKI